MTQKGVGGDDSRKHHMVLQRTVPTDTHKHVCCTENYPQRKVKRPAAGMRSISVQDFYLL